MGLFLTLLVLYYVGALIILTTVLITDAMDAWVMLPQRKPLWELFCYGLRIVECNDQWYQHGKALVHLFVRFGILTPAFTYMLLLDEIFFPGYHALQVEKPVISLVTPRSGSTSFHKMLSLDQRYMTPTLIELCIPCLTLHIGVYHVLQCLPASVRTYLSDAFKAFVFDSEALEAAHRVDFLAPEVDDLMMSSLHYTSFVAARFVPTPQFMTKYTSCQCFTPTEREQTNRLVNMALKKMLYKDQLLTGTAGTSQAKRLLIRSHRSNWTRDFAKLYPDAIYMGIVRDPVSILESFAYLVNHMVNEKQQLGSIFGDIDSRNPQKPASLDRTLDTSTWSGSCVSVLRDCFGSEADLYETDPSKKPSPDYPTGYYTTFPAFREDPVTAIQNLYEVAGIPMADEFLRAMHQATEDHKTYKQRHKYQNPSLAQLAVKEETYRAIPEVQRYTALLKKGPSQKTKSST